jgi:hypothetical protein
MSNIKTGTFSLVLDSKKGTLWISYSHCAEIWKPCYVPGQFLIDSGRNTLTNKAITYQNLEKER